MDTISALTERAHAIMDKVRAGQGMTAEEVKIMEEFNRYRSGNRAGNAGRRMSKKNIQKP